MSSFKEAEGNEVLDVLYNNPDAKMSIDTETTGLHVAGGFDFCIGVSVATVIKTAFGPIGYAHYWGLAHETGENVAPETYEKLAYVLENHTGLLIFANVIFDTHSLLTVGIDVRKSSVVDICAQAHLIDENMPQNKGVDSLAKHYLDEPGKIVDPFVEKEKKSGNHNITPEQMFDYAVTDAVSTYRIHDVLEEHREWRELPSDIWEHKQKLIRVLTEMKTRGVLVDIEETTRQEALGTKMMAELREELGMNPGSSKQMAELLIDQLKMPVLKRSPKTNAPSFTKEVMEEYDILLERSGNPIAKTLMAYRGWAKATTASLRPFLNLVDPDGRIRCSYKLHGTVTGRFSCSEPNLQQIPKESTKPWNGEIKKCFVPKPGFKLVEFDYSQLELRLATAYAKVMDLMQVFDEGRDIFGEMSKTLGMTRDDTKRFVYTIQYGGGVKRLVTVFGVTPQRAKGMIDNYYGAYPNFRAFSARCGERCRQDGKNRLWTKRYRHFRFPQKEDYKAMNSVIQGGAADIVERVMVKLFDEVDCDDCQMLLQVHDSVTFEIREDRVEEFSDRIKGVMEGYPTELFGVKFAVEGKVWGS